MSQVLLRRYDFPPRISGHLFVSFPGPTRSSSIRVSQFALLEGRRALPLILELLDDPSTRSVSMEGTRYEFYQAQFFAGEALIELLGKDALPYLKRKPVGANPYMRRVWTDMIQSISAR